MAAFLEEYDQFKDNPEYFKTMLTLAASKFEFLTEETARDLKKLHEHLAIAEGQEKAEAGTGIPRSAIEKVKAADAIAEIAAKWGRRLIQYAPWVMKILDDLNRHRS